jgi:hypothetical protein
MDSATFHLWMKEFHTPKFLQAIFTQYFFAVMGVSQPAEATFRDTATFHLWMKEFHTPKFLQTIFTQYFFAVMGLW